MDVFTINEETCNQCGACASVCHFGLIEFQKKSYPQPVSVAEMCSRCAACMVVCPTQSIVLRDVSYEQCPPINPAYNVSHEQLVQVIKSRRSVRSYRARKVPRDLIERIIETVRYSPTGNNAQNVNWLVFDGKSELQYFRNVGFDWVLEVAKHLSLPPAWVELLRERRETRNEDFFLRGAPLVVSTYAEHGDAVNAASCVIALAYFDLIAASLGLGCCWNGLFSGAANSFPPVKERVRLPEGFEVHGSLMVGYPKYKYNRIPPRKPAQITWR